MLLYHLLLGFPNGFPPGVCTHFIILPRIFDSYLIRQLSFLTSRSYSASRVGGQLSGLRYYKSR
jgi:glutamate racemase